MYPVLKQINRIDEFEHWPVSIKSTLQWFPFLEIMEYTVNSMGTRESVDTRCAQP